MDELVMFTRNLSPGMTNMTKQVDGRQADLTNPSHATILGEESEEVTIWESEGGGSIGLK